MKKQFSRFASTLVTLGVGALIGFGCSESARQSGGKAEASEAETSKGTTASRKKVKRFGSVIGLKPEMKAKYIKLHADTWPEVLGMIEKCNIRNYSIYLAELEGKLYLFSYFEYTGDDWDADTQKMKDDPKTNQWWAVTDPCQTRLPGTPEGEQWLKIKEVFHTD